MARDLPQLCRLCGQATVGKVGHPHDGEDFNDGSDACECEEHSGRVHQRKVRDKVEKAAEDVEVG